jgi:ABC-type glycerol-3-phosphate transport system substrate-binding protein
VRAKVPLILMVIILLCGSTLVSAQKVQITFHHRTHSAEIEWAKVIIERFEKLHPDIQVNLITTSTGTAYQEKIAVLTAAGSPPDVFSGYGDKLGFIVRGFAKDITELAQRDAAELQINNFFPGVWEAPIFNGRLYGIPFTITTQLLFYNRDLLQQNGLSLLPTDWDDTVWNWDQLVEYGRRLTVKDPSGRFTQLAITQAQESSIPDVCWMFGGDWFEPAAYETGWVERTTFYTPQNIRAYQAQVDLYANYAAAGANKGMVPWTGFTQGKIAMDWIGNWRMGSILELRKAGGLNFSLGIAPPPLVENRDNTRWTNPLFLSSYSKHPEEAWEFIKFATNQESQELWVQMTRLLPARRTASQLYMQSLADVFDMPLGQIQTVINGSIAHSRRSTEEAIFDLPLEIIRRKAEWIDTILAGIKPVEAGLADLDKSLTAYAKEVLQRL